MGDREEDQSVLDETLCSESNSKRVNSNAEKLFNENQALVGYVLNKSGIYQGPHYEDFQQQGYLGLWEACLNFDESKGFQFATYACPMIKGRILRYAREKIDPVRLPRSHKTIQTIMNRYGFSVPLSEEEIAIIVAESDKTIRECTVRKYQDILFSSLDVPFSEDNETTLGDSISDDIDFRDLVESLTEDQLDYAISEIIKYISDKSVARDLVGEYLYASLHGIKIRQLDLAKKYNISQPTCNKILVYARKKFKRHEKEIFKLFGII